MLVNSQKTGLSLFLKMIGVDFETNLFTKNSNEFFQFLNIWLCWGLVRFDLYLIGKKFSAFHFEHRAPFYKGFQLNSPHIIKLSVIKIFNLDNDNISLELKFETLDEIVKFPEYDIYSVAKYKCFVKKFDIINLNK
jgi:hypothetical protein